MSIAYGSRVGSANGATSVSSFSATTSGAIPAGSLIIVSVSCSNVGDLNDLSSVTDAAGNTYVSGGHTVDGGQNTLTAVWYCANCLALASSSLVTAHLTSALLTSGEAWRLAVDYATGMATSSVTDGSQGKNSQLGATWNTGTGITTTNAADLLWVANGINQGEPAAVVAADCSPTSGWTIQTGIINGGNSGDSLRTAYNIVAATGTYHGGGTCTTGSNGDSAVIVAFKGASGGTVSGSGSMIGNSTVASGGVNIEAGADTAVANATLSGPANLLAAAESVTGNATLAGAAALVAGPESVTGNSTLGGSASLLAGMDALTGNSLLSVAASLVSSGALSGNGVLTSGGAILLIGPSGLVGNSSLFGGIASIVAGPEALISNSILLNPAISSGGSLVSNAILSGAGTVVAGGTLQGNGVLAAPGAILIIGPNALVGNGVLFPGGARILAGPEALVGNSLILNPNISAGGSLVGNSILSGSGIIVAGGLLSGNATLSGAATLLAGLFPVSSSGVLSGPATIVAGPEAMVALSIIATVLLKIPGIVTLTDLALALAILTDSAPVALLTDTAPLAILGDEYGQ